MEEEKKARELVRWRDEAYGMAIYIIRTSILFEIVYRVFWLSIGEAAVCYGLRAWEEKDEAGKFLLYLRPRPIFILILITYPVIVLPPFALPTATFQQPPCCRSLPFTALPVSHILSSFYE